MLVSSTPWAMSERRVEDVVDVLAQGRRIDLGKLRPVSAQLFEGRRRAGKGDELGHRLTGAGDRQPFTALDSVHDLTAVVP
mgnify:CR=1 FL=1